MSACWKTGIPRRVAISTVLILGLAIDDDEFVDQWIAVDQIALDSLQDLADGRFFIERRDRQTDGKALPFFEVEEIRDGAEFIAVKRVFGEPAIDYRRDIPGLGGLLRFFGGKAPQRNRLVRLHDDKRAFQSPRHEIWNPAQQRGRRLIASGGPHDHEVMTRAVRQQHGLHRLGLDLQLLRSGVRYLPADRLEISLFNGPAAIAPQADIHMQQREYGTIALGQRLRQPKGQLGVRTAANG